MQIDPNISSDNKTVDISLYYTGGAAHGVQFMGVDTEGFDCETKIPSPQGLKLFNPSVTTYVDRERMKIRCKRTSSTKETIDNTTYTIVPRGTISVKTADTDMNLFFSSEMSPPLPVMEAARINAKIDDLSKRTVPVGTIVSSILDWTGFKTVVKDSKHWVPADGRDIPIGSIYSKLFLNQKAPDLRGMFLRGLNYIESGNLRKDGKEDPDGANRVSGDYQQDQLKRHTHKAQGKFTPVPGGIGEAVGYPTKWEINVKENEDGGMETRPRNIAVYYYLRIN